MPAPSVERPSDARSTCDATAAHTPAAPDRPCARCLLVRSHTPAASAARPSTGASTWCATARRTRARGPLPVGSAARASGAASMCCATSASTVGRWVVRAGRVRRALRAGDPSRPGLWDSRPATLGSRCAAGSLQHPLFSPSLSTLPPALAPTVFTLSVVLTFSVLSSAPDLTFLLSSHFRSSLLIPEPLPSRGRYLLVPSCFLPSQSTPLPWREEQGGQEQQAGLLIGG